NAHSGKSWSRAVSAFTSATARATRSMQPVANCAAVRKRRRRLLESKQEWERGRVGEREARNPNITSPSRRPHRELVEANFFHGRIFEHAIHHLLDPGAKLCKSWLGQLFTR